MLSVQQSIVANNRKESYPKTLQGTNAHALLCGSDTPAAAAQQPQQQPAWARRRFWFAPAPHAMLHRGGVASGGSILLFQTSVSRCAFAGLTEVHHHEKPC